MKSIIFVSCIVCIMFLSGFAHADSYLEQDTDRGGLDFDNFTLPRPIPEMCGAACDATAGCKAWTYVRPNQHQGPEPRCWLKSGVAAPVETDCCVSGVKWEQDTDRGGLDFDNFTLPKADPALCQEACFMESRCRAWTYVHPNQHQGPEPRCWLKNAIPAPSPNDCCVSGIK